MLLNVYWTEPVKLCSHLIFAVPPPSLCASTFLLQSEGFPDYPNLQGTCKGWMCNPGGREARERRAASLIPSEAREPRERRAGKKKYSPSDVSVDDYGKSHEICGWVDMEELMPVSRFPYRASTRSLFSIPGTRSRYTHAGRQACNRRTDKQTGMGPHLDAGRPRGRRGQKRRIRLAAGRDKTWEEVPHAG